MRTILKILKYLFVVIILLVIFIIGGFIYYTSRLDYKIPKIVNVEIFDKNGEKYLSLNNDSKQNYIQIENIDQEIIDAFISIEDKKFYSHKGIDIKRIGGALMANLTNQEITQGGSTITQQYARNLFLTSSQSYRRKIEEIMIAINLESKYNKDEILEGYLNSIYFDHGIYGIEDACLFYFNKHASDVSLAEAASLAAIPKGPVYYSPINNPESNKARRYLIIEEMLEDGKITEAQSLNAKAEDLNLYGKLDRIEDENAPYYQDLIMKELAELKIIERYDNLKIYTSLDLKLNQITLDAIKKYYPNNSELEIAIYAMDPKTGAVLTSIGGLDYQTSTYNRSTMALRQPGSAIKPFLYYAALDYGFTPATTFQSSKTNFYVNGNIYSPTNFNDIYAERDVSMAYAIAVSDNIYAIKTHLFLGTDVMVDTLKNFGFTTPINDNVSLALGTSEVYLSELVAGYARFANLGKDVEASYILKIVDEKGKLIYEADEDFKQKYSKENCYILTETMTNVFDNRLAINISTTGSAIANKLTKKYAGKSGTTNTDNWMIGYNSDLVLGIWTGYDEKKFIENAEVKYIKYVWAEIMENYLKDRPQGWYETPNNIISIKINPTTGLIAKKNEYKKDLYFKEDNLPWYIFN
ncbi:MAG: PBP1A family penicillin-binding protein [Bacilli bacterium]|nr:PBP1A family penicillin-binding protein [Bacilli bacterium]